MTRYIDADALIEDIRKHSESYFADDFAHEWVDQQPTIDAVPVIRCRDCKHGKEDEDGLIECTFWDFMNHTHSNDPNGFCFRAEPKETE